VPRPTEPRSWKSTQPFCSAPYSLEGLRDCPRRAMVPRLPGRAPADRRFFRDRRRSRDHETGTGNSHAGPTGTPRLGLASRGRSRMAVVDVATRTRLLSICVEPFRRCTSRVGIGCLVVHFLLAPEALRGVTHPVLSLSIRRAKVCLGEKHSQTFLYSQPFM
jgi:hypothetical protein